VSSPTCQYPMHKKGRKGEDIATTRTGKRKDQKGKSQSGLARKREGKYNPTEGEGATNHDKKT